MIEYKSYFKDKVKVDRNYWLLVICGFSYFSSKLIELEKKGIF